MTATTPTPEPRDTLRTVTRVVGHGPDEARRARARSARLQEVKHEGVCVPQSVALDPEGAVVATFPYVHGATAASLLQTRGQLTLGECVYLGVHLAEALAAMHSAGLVHGDVSPANVMVTEAGVVLVDTLADLSGRELGTPGFAAPERPEGASRAADAYSLGRLLQRVAEDDALAAISAWTKPLCEEQAGDRESVERAAVALRECAPQQRISTPTLSATDAVRGRALDPASVTVVRPEARSWRIESAIRRWAPRAGVAIAGVVVVLLVGSVMGGGGGGAAATASDSAPRVDDGARWDVPVVGTRDAPRVALSEVEFAAARATTERVEAIARGDGEALLALTVPGSSTQQRDAELAELLTSGLVEYEGLTVTQVRVTEVFLSGDAARATVSYHVSESRVWEGDAWRTEPPFEQRVTLVLRLLGQRWLVEDVISRNPALQGG